MTARITYLQAAAILECGVSNIPKMIRRGVLTRGGRGRGPSLDRAEVENLAQERRANAAAIGRRREARLNRPDPTPPVVDDHRWLTPTQAGILIGVVSQTVRNRCNRGTIPHVRNEHGFWIREDHARLVAQADATIDDRDVASIRHRVLAKKI